MPTDGQGTYGATVWITMPYYSYPYVLSSVNIFNAQTSYPVQLSEWQPWRPSPSNTWQSYQQTGGSVQILSSGSFVTDPTTPGYREERRRQARLDDLAAERAKALLLEHLSEEQRREYEENNFFHVISQSGVVYRIRRGSVGNVFQIGLDGNPEHKFCIHARDSVPQEDNMLAQMLMLSYDEERFLAIANRHY